MSESIVEWAAQFICPNCGRCVPAMVTTMKSCSCCRAPLIRWESYRAHPKEKAARIGLKNGHSFGCRVSVAKREAISAEHQAF